MAGAGNGGHSLGDRPQNFRDLYEADGNYPIDEDQPRCNSISNRGRRCGKQACLGATTCKFHFGGPKDMKGRYDAYIKSEKLRERYKRHLTDGELTDQRDDLALLRAMCETIVEKHTAVLEAEGDEVDEARLSAMSGAIERVTRLVEAITRREQAQEFLIHVDDVTKAISKVSEIIARNITDQGLVRSIIAELTAIQLRRTTSDPDQLFRLPAAALDVPPNHEANALSEVPDAP